MKRSIFASGSYCQLLRQWTRHSRSLVSDGKQKAFCYHDNLLKLPRCIAPGISTPVREARRSMCTVAEVGSEQQEEVFHIDIPDDKHTHIQVPFRTKEDDPTKHNMDHEGLFYNVHKEDYVKYFQFSGQWPDYLKNVKTFNECAVMIRKPALEVCEMIDSMNMNHPAVNIVFYGKLGSGKTLTLAHVVHTYAKQGWFTVHVPMLIELLRKKAYTTPELIPSKFFEGQKYDMNDAAVTWLKFCKLQNPEHLEALKTTKEYSWTEREACTEGTSLLEITTFGIERRVFASDCVGIILRELKLAASDKKIKLLVAADGINGFFKATKIPTNDKKLLNAQEITIFHYLANMFQPTWSNGACVGTLCPAVACLNTEMDRYRSPYTPQALLQKEGFEYLDPFIPVLVPDYTTKEVYNCLEYYLDRKWIQRPQGQTEEGKKELILLSNKNPLELMSICSYW